MSSFVYEEPPEKTVYNSIAEFVYLSVLRANLRNRQTVFDATVIDRFRTFE